MKDHCYVVLELSTHGYELLTGHLPIRPPITKNAIKSLPRNDRSSSLLQMLTHAVVQFRTFHLHDFPSIGGTHMINVPIICTDVRAVGVLSRRDSKLQALTQRSCL